MKFFILIYLYLKFCNAKSRHIKREDFHYYGPHYPVFEDARQDPRDYPIVDPLTWENCNSDQFDCGEKCIDKSGVCDGYRNCSNGADENNDFCEIKNAHCYMPAKTSHMTFTLNYTFNATDKKRPPLVPEYVQGVFTCDPGYLSEHGNSVVSTCVQRSWEPSIPICLKPCVELNTTNMVQECYYQNEQINCNKVMMEGTWVTLSCQEIYFHPNYDRILCQSSGQWSISPNDIKCHPSCGLYDQEISKMMKNRDFPWRVLIKETVDKSENFFSGTLIDTKLIISDKSSFNRSVNPDDFLIIVNDDIASWGPLKSYEVSEIHFIDQHFRDLESPSGLGCLVIFETVDVIEFGLTVLPACISTYSHPIVQEIINSSAQIVTVGNANEHKDLYRDEIAILNVSTIDDNACSRLVNHTNWFSDQFCGILKGSKNLTDADRGTGLVKIDKETNLYFLEGVYGGHSNSNVMTFTFISDYIEWIDAIRAKVNHGKPIHRIKEPHHKPGSNLLIVFVLLSFVILIAIFMRIR